MSYGTWKVKKQKKNYKILNISGGNFLRKKKRFQKKNPIPRNLSENRHAVQPSHLVIHPSEQLE